MAGRPAIPYSEKYHPPWARSLCRRGLIFPEIASELGIGKTTLKKWVNLYPELKEAMTEGKSVADAAVENSLFRRAMGYEYEEEKVITTKGGTRKECTVKHLASDVTACIFWLKNRRPDMWCDVQKRELTGANGQPLSPPVIQVAFVDAVDNDPDEKD